MRSSEYKHTQIFIPTREMQLILHKDANANPSLESEIFYRMEDKSII